MFRRIFGAPAARAPCVICQQSSGRNLANTASTYAFRYIHGHPQPYMHMCLNRHTRYHFAKSSQAAAQHLFPYARETSFSQSEHFCGYYYIKLSHTLKAVPHQKRLSDSKVKQWRYSKHSTDLILFLGEPFYVLYLLWLIHWTLYSLWKLNWIKWDMFFWQNVFKLLSGKVMTLVTNLNCCWM